MSSSRTPVLTNGAPAPAPFLSQGVVMGNLVFCSGQVGMNPETGALIEGTVTDRTKQILENLKAVLKAAGSGLDQVGKVNIFLTKPEDFGAVNAVYASYFSQPMPARTCVFVKALPLDTDVEIECVGNIIQPTKSVL